MTPRLTLKNTWKYLFLFISSLVMLFPFIWMILSTLKPPNEILSITPTLFPKELTFDNYPKVWYEINFARYFQNSMFVTGTAVVIQLYASSIIGYTFGKLKFRFRNTLFFMIIACMMIPMPVLIIPKYQLMVWFKWIDSYKALIIPNMVSLFGVFMMRQFSTSIPDSLIEAARIDGASEFRIFHIIIFPLLKTAMSALAILQFLWVWNDFLWPYLIITSENKLTLPIGLSLFNGQWSVDYPGVLTGASISIVPVLIVYMIFQKKFIEGVTMSGIK